MEAQESMAAQLNQLQSIQKERDSLQASVEVVNGQVAELRNIISQQKQNLETLSREKSQAIAGESLLRGRVKELEARIIELEKQVEEAFKERDSALAAQNNLKGRLDEKDTMLGKKETQLEKLGSDLRLAQAELEKLKAQLTIRSEQLAREEAARKEIEEENQKLARLHAPCDEMINEMKSRIASLEGQLKDAQLALKQALDQVKEAQLALKQAQDGWNDALKTSGSSEAEIAALKKKIADLQRDLDDIAKKYAPCPGLIRTLQDQLAAESEQLAAFRKEHAPCEGMISGLRDQIANLEKKVKELEERNDEEPIIQFSKPTRAVRSAPPPPSAADEPQIQLSSRQTATRRSPMHGKHMVGLGMTLVVKVNKMVVADVAAGGGADQSGQIERGDSIVGVASSLDAPIRAVQTLDQVHDWLLGPDGTQVMILMLELEQAGGETKYNTIEY